MSQALVHLSLRRLMAFWSYNDKNGQPVSFDNLEIQKLEKEYVIEGGFGGADKGSGKEENCLMYSKSRYDHVKGRRRREDIRLAVCLVAMCICLVDYELRVQYSISYTTVKNECECLMYVISFYTKRQCSLC
jgi:hypothetical protein